MFETYRMLGREREKELESEAVRLRPLAGRPINRISVVTVAVIVAAFAFGATMARAEVWPEGRTGAQLTTQPSSPDLIERWVASHKTHMLAPDDRIQVRPTEASNQVAPPDLIERWVASHKTHMLAPDDRIRVRPTEASNQVAPPDLIERWVASHGPQVGEAPRPASTSHTGEAFDWRAALVGASTTAALALALGIGIGITRRSRIRSAAA
jgi:hypothetical protein